jgi:hypothetical protein
VLLASGELQRLAASRVRHCDRAMILSDMAAGRIACTRTGGPLLHCGLLFADFNSIVTLCYVRSEIVTILKESHLPLLVF